MAKAKGKHPDEVLKLFDETATRIMKTRFVTHYRTWRLPVAPGAGRKRFPSDETVVAFFTAFRQIFLLKREPIYIDRVYEAAITKFTDPEVNECLKELQRLCPVYREPVPSLVTEWQSHWFHSDRRGLFPAQPTFHERFVLQFGLWPHIEKCLREMELLRHVIRLGAERQRINES